MPETEKIQQPEEEKVGDGAKKRQRAKATRKASRFAGLILFFVLFLLGILLWVSGEGRDVTPPSSERVPTSSPPAEPGDVIIIE